MDSTTEPEWIDAEEQTFTELVRANKMEAGTEIEVNIDLGDGRKRKMRFLVGNINELGGVCDDCPEFRRDQPVIRYRTVWKVEQP